VNTLKKTKEQNRKKRVWEEISGGQSGSVPKGIANELNRFTANMRDFHYETPKVWNEIDINEPLSRSKNFPHWWQEHDIPAAELRERKLIDFSDKVYVAPLTTIGNLPWRRLLISLGADITCAEMSLASSLIDGANTEWAHLRRHPDEKIFGIQITAPKPYVSGRACEMIRDYCQVDFVDINMGCPLDTVCNNGMGAFLPTKIKKAESIVKSCLAVLPCAVTCKIRTGWTNDKRSAHTFVGFAQSWQVKGHSLNCVFIHGRSRNDRYSRLADWDYINTVASLQDDYAAPLPIIGNGDILTYHDYEMSRKTAPNTCNCAMLGRGAIIKPWLPTEIKEKRNWDVSAPERLEFLKTFVRYGLEHWGADETGIARTRRFLLEMLSFTCRYTPVGLLERLPQRIHDRPPRYYGRSDLETLLSSPAATDWVKISNMLLGPAPSDFSFQPKHASNSYAIPAAQSYSSSDADAVASSSTKGPMRDWG